MKLKFFSFSFFGIVGILMTVFSGTVFAQGTGDFSSGDNYMSGINEVNSLLEDKKNALLQDLSSSKDSLSQKINSAKEEVFTGEDYKILTSLDKFNLNLEEKKQNRYFDIKTDIINEFSQLSTEIVLLEEKISEGLLDSEEFWMKKEDIVSDIKALETKYSGNIDDYKSSYEENIQEKKQNYEDLLETEEELLERVKQNEKALLEMKEKYSKFNGLIEKINNLYLINSDNLYEYIGSVKELTRNSLSKLLQNRIDYFSGKYVNLDHYSKDINEFKDSLLDKYEDKLDDYFEDITSGFYKEEEYSYIKTNFKQLEDNYFSSSGVIYTEVQSGDIEEEFSKLEEKMDSVNNKIEEKLEDLDSPETVRDVKESLNEKMKDFYNEEKTVFVGKMEDFINKQIELLNYKTEEDLNRYNNLQSKKEELKNLSGSLQKQIDAYEDFVSNLSGSIDKFISDDLKNKLRDDYWNYRMKLDAMRIQKLERSYTSDYEDIDSKIQSIFDKLHQDYSQKGKGNKFLEKLKGAMSKIEGYLQNQKISNKSRYLLLNIRKNVIKFVYLE